MKVKVLLDLERLRRPHSGIANVFRNLARGIEETQHNFNFTYFGVFTTINFPLNEQKKWKRLHKIYENFSQKFDIIHVSHQASLYFTRNYKNSIKIVTLHDLNFLHENLPEKKKKKLLLRLNKNLEYADYIVCISQFVKADFEENIGLFRLKKLKKVEVIHNGIQLPEVRKYELGKFACLAAKKYMLNIGVLFDKKNQLKLVEMLPFLEEDLVLVASGEKEPYATEVRNKIKELKLENRVHFLKNISEEEKYALIQNCEAMCHPSTAEGFGIPPIEAMAFGKPVFLSEYTSLPEIGGDSAFYFKNFEPELMAKFYREKMKLYHENQEEFSLKIKNWVKQFDYKAMAANYLDFYKRISEDSTS
ncbi:glycosyl transferase family 1 [Kaistella solincola]|uniref:Glycosyl transferase family 1 n=1 Tax=Kaistella solincola TaxID=510955 RepID=A0ABR4ZSI0_9FLAO|nr:glycosyltransferase family 1 protein [Kaistella solincola]KIA84210.1 glycosyl transferase family 1 [Kaistella solincola]